MLFILLRGVYNAPLFLVELLSAMGVSQIRILRFAQNDKAEYSADKDSSIRAEFVNKIKMKNTIILVLTAMAFLSLPVYANTGETEGEDHSGYITMDWDRNVEMTDEDISLSEALERKISCDGAEEASDKGNFSILGVKDYSPRTDIPDKFPADGSDDLETLKTYLQDKYPLPKNQGSFGTCWAHSVVALAEFYGINNLELPRTADLSELYLALSIFKPRNNKAVGNEAEAGEVSFSGSDRDQIDHGANLKFAAQLLSKGYGYVIEDELPYISDFFDPAFDSSGNLAADIDVLDDEESIRFTDMYQVDLSLDTGKKIVKEAIIRNGIVGVSYSHKSGYYYTSGDYTSYYCNYKYSANHAVCLVGWDDDYPVDRFNPSRRPDNPGAWLVRNSWCSSDDDFYRSGGYFWMSYEDKTLQNSAYIFDVTDDTEGYENVYYYDTQIHDTKNLCDYSLPDLNWYSANVYKVPDDGNEILKEIHFETGSDTDYEVTVYTGLTDPLNPESGILQESATVSGTLAFPGIYTISLNSPVELLRGSSFSVLVRTKGGTLDYEAPCGNGIYNVACGIREGQSFYKYEGGTWKDMANDRGHSYGGNFCISAHTVDAGSFTLTVDDFSFEPPEGNLYNGAPHGVSFSSAMSGGITVYYNDGFGEWTTTAPVIPGTYKVKILVSGSSGFYDACELSDDSWTFTIEKGILTIGADNKSVVRGGKMPEFTYSLKGFESGDPFDEKPVLTCAAADTLTAGVFSITAAGGTLKDPEYFEKVEYKAGTLTVTEEESGSGEEGGSGSGEGGSGSGEGGSGSGEGGSGSGEGGSGSGEGGSGSGEGGSGSGEGGSGSGEGNSDSGEDGGEGRDPGSGEDGGEGVKPGDGKGEDTKESVFFEDAQGVSVNLIFDSSNNTFETPGGESVLVLSTVSGEAVPEPEYEYTGKKITPGKNGLIVYNGVIYRYKRDYRISFRRNKNSGNAIVSVKWKKRSIPYLKGERRKVSGFRILPRTVRADMVYLRLSGEKIKSILVHTGSSAIKAAKRDYTYRGNIFEGFDIVFMNNFSGSVSKKI